MLLGRPHHDEMLLFCVRIVVNEDAEQKKFTDLCYNFVNFKSSLAEEDRCEYSPTFGGSSLAAKLPLVIRFYWHQS
ncbi:hypothetical protein Dda3937_04551 [Dickeya dadantii 3937]|uniref:Uncharacterized protein n=1 Tax=Dickeya dadantii (strain 3937) TaxID=198628 RepID=E0SLZ0_DICD3|nr:hypothetical protein Dda3937_04551 [Dickeya dadantii 3937]